MSAALYDSFIADYYDESPWCRSGCRTWRYYRDAAARLRHPVLELGCGTGRSPWRWRAGKRITGLGTFWKRMLGARREKRGGLRVEAANAFNLVQATWRNSI